MLLYSEEHLKSHCFQKLHKGKRKPEAVGIVSYFDKIHKIHH